MSIIQTLCTSFKTQLLLGVHDFRVTAGDQFKLALYTAYAKLDASTVAYTAEGEVTGTNYPVGGMILTNLGVSSASGVGFANFANLVFSNVTLTARGALVYNTTPSALDADGNLLSNPAVCVLDFGSDKSAVSKSFTVQFPASTAEYAIIRVA